MIQNNAKNRAALVDAIQKFLEERLPRRDLQVEITSTSEQEEMGIVVATFSQKGSSVPIIWGNRAIKAPEGIEESHVKKWLKETLQDVVFEALEEEGLESAFTINEPNPGSTEAYKQGCKCPRMDNHNGKGRGGMGEEFGWITFGDCPLHGFDDEQEQEQE